MIAAISVDRGGPATVAAFVKMLRLQAGPPQTCLATWTTASSSASVTGADTRAGTTPAVLGRISCS